MRSRDVVLGLALLATSTGCGKDAPSSPKPSTGPGHAHSAPHGGEVLDLGDEEAHLELIHDHTGGNVTVYVLDADLKTPIATAAPVILIKTAKGPQEFTLTAVDPAADGTSTTWKGSHPGLVADPWEGRIRITIRGKAYQSPLEGPAHGH